MIRLPKFIYRPALRLALRHMRSRPADLIIGVDYLFRWRLFPKNRWLNIYLHRVQRSDVDRVLHDHPWHNASIILDGSYIEVMQDGDRLLAPGSVVFRRARLAHRLVVKRGPVISLFLIGLRHRQWGFHCPQGWRHWRAFTERQGVSGGQKGCE